MQAYQLAARFGVKTIEGMNDKAKYANASNDINSGFNCVELRCSEQSGSAEDARKLFRH